MAAFFAFVKAPAVKFKKDKDGELQPVARIVLESGDNDPHELADNLAAMDGLRVKVSITLEQTKLEE